MENRNGTSMCHGLSRSVHEVWWSSYKQEHKHNISKE